VDQAPPRVVTVVVKRGPLIGLVWVGVLPMAAWISGALLDELLRIRHPRTSRSPQA
jgi:hypothetical protein